MKKSEQNQSVIENFILHLTHSDRDERDEYFNDEQTYTPKAMYEVADGYIKEDHVDGEDNEQDFIPTFTAESSFDHEDKAKEYPENIVVVADFGDEGTQTIATILLHTSQNPENLEAIQELLAFISDPYKHKC